MTLPEGMEMEVRVVQPGEGNLINLSSGDTITPKMRKGDTAGQYAFIEYVSKAGQGVPFHIHDGHDELWYIVEGELMMGVGDESFPAAVGSTWFVPRNVPHAFWNASDQPCKFVAIFSPGGYEEWFTERTRLLHEGKATPELLQEVAETKYHTRTIGPIPEHLYTKKS